MKKYHMYIANNCRMKALFLYHYTPVKKHDKVFR